MAYPEYRLAGRVPVDEEESEIGERVAECGHLPVDDRQDPARVTSVDDRVVEPVVAVDDRRPALRRCRPGQSPMQFVERGQVAGRDPAPLPMPAPDLTLEVPGGPAEVTEADLLRVE